MGRKDRESTTALVDGMVLSTDPVPAPSSTGRNSGRNSKRKRKIDGSESSGRRSSSVNSPIDENPTSPTASIQYPKEHVGESMIDSITTIWSEWSQKIHSYLHPDELPSALPVGWPYPTPQALADRPSRIIQVGKSQKYIFPSNFVKTSKYEVWNFLPKFLLETFNPSTKIANCYFLAISALQCVPAVSNTGGMPTTLVPLTFVVGVDGLFQILEDLSRHAADKKANASKSRRFNQSKGQFEECEWKDISIGDVVQVNTREQIPADLIILNVAEKQTPATGMCYVETKSMDGETNLKLRMALPSTLGAIKTDSDLKKLRGTIEMEHPNKLIESFNGVIDLKNYGRDVVMPANVLLRGCVLRNTEWVNGIVVNTGHDTKIMMSSTGTRSKTSVLESQASSEIEKIIVMLGLLCFTGATGQLIWNSVHDVGGIPYLKFDPSPAAFWLIDFFYFFLLHCTFIPVSLYVSMSMARFFQSRFMNKDLEMYYDKTDSPATVRTMTLNEELGQISYVFSDKTGTLTCNVMNFRKASIGGVSYGLGITEIGKAAWKLQGKPVSKEILSAEAKAQAASVPHVSFYCPLHEAHMKESGEERKRILNFYRVLSICHDVIAERVDGYVKFSASNPDDEALVCAADYFGYKFMDRAESSIQIANKHVGRSENLGILSTIEFTSKRKLMSVVVRDTDGRIRLLSKGADTAVTARLSPGQDEMLTTTCHHMKEFSVEGLRCLYVAERVLNEEWFDQWRIRYESARTNLKEIEKMKQGLSNDIESLHDELERDLTLIGLTAIEDKLQDGVPEAIALMADAGIKIWVLTGDKEETAINIAVACNLLLPTDYMQHIIVNSGIANTAPLMLELIMTEIANLDADERSDDALPRALIIDGASLIIALDQKNNPELRSALLTLSQRCAAVVCCRVSPDQKREMVALIKEGVPGVRTLAIGDGANDVAMIQEAHIGVGIRGEEGLQAVNSSDYAIAQFRYIAPLVLKHGRYNLIRMSSLICYMFYKNIAMSMGQFWYNFFCAWSGQKYYTEPSIQLYNLCYTALPIMIVAVYDRDLFSTTVMRFPRVYQAGVKGAYFSSRVFWIWIANGVVESIICSIPALIFMNSGTKDGTLEHFLIPGMICLTVNVITCNIKILFMQAQWFSISLLLTFLTVVYYYGTLGIFNSFIAFDDRFYHVFAAIWYSPQAWLTTLLLCTAIIIKDTLWYGYHRLFNPTAVEVLQEMEESSNLESPAVKKNRMKKKKTMRRRHSKNPFHLANNEDLDDGVELNKISSSV